MQYKVGVLVEKDEHGYYAWCPTLEGCQSQGDSLDEAVANIREAIALYLDTLSEEERNTSMNREFVNTTVEVEIA